MEHASVPSMAEGPPVTRARMLWMEGGPVKVAVWPWAMLKASNEWKRLGPTDVPRDGVMLKLGPVSVVRGPTVPSVFTWANAHAGAKRTGRRRNTSRRQDGVIVCPQLLRERDQFRPHFPCAGAGAPEDLGAFAGLLLVGVSDQCDGGVGFL